MRAEQPHPEFIPPLQSTHWVLASQSKGCKGRNLRAKQNTQGLCLVLASHQAPSISHEFVSKFLAVGNEFARFAGNASHAIPQGLLFLLQFGMKLVQSKFRNPCFANTKFIPKDCPCVRIQNARFCGIRKHRFCFALASHEFARFAGSAEFARANPRKVIACEFGIACEALFAKRCVVLNSHACVRIQHQFHPKLNLA